MTETQGTPANDEPEPQEGTQAEPEAPEGDDGEPE